MEKKICSFTAPGYRLQLIVKNDNYLIILNRRRIAIVQPNPNFDQPISDCAMILFCRLATKFVYHWSIEEKRNVKNNNYGKEF